jgi:hypothetical protein
MSTPENADSYSPLPSTEVDWRSQRAQLVEAGDTEGAELLDAVLASPRRGKSFHGVVRGANGIPDHETTMEPLTDEEILNALRDRRNGLESRAKLRADLEPAATTIAGLCDRWQKLAAWVGRFDCRREGTAVIDFGNQVAAARMFPTLPGRAIKLEWAEAFRETTKNLGPAIREAGLPVEPRHRLLRALDDVLKGKKVHLEKALLELDDVVRELAERQADSGPLAQQYEAVATCEGMAKCGPGVGAKERWASAAGESTQQEVREAAVQEAADGEPGCLEVGRDEGAASDDEAERRKLQIDHIRLLKAVVNAKEGELRTRDLEAVRGMCPRTKNRRLNELKDDGLVERLRQGRWRITAEGRRAYKKACGSGDTE